MYREYLGSASFFVALRRLDEEIAAEARSGGCPRCGGALYTANYPRRPRGLGFAVEGELAVRLSLCCGREGCRRRVTPPSVRFFGRRVYAAVASEIVERFGGVGDGEGVGRCLRFLSPLSTASCPNIVRVAGAGGLSRRR